jgi:hypothetical protein
MAQGTTANPDGSTIRYENSPLFISGSNVRSGAPTIAGFPLKDQAPNHDARYAKAFYRSNTGSLNLSGDRRFLWITSEIVSSWYFQTIGGRNNRGQSYQGDASETITAGYGDLVYTFDVHSSAQNPTE